MKPLKKALLLALVHALLVCSLGAKLLYDRATRPRVWVKVAPADPDLPIRGRYLTFNMELPLEGQAPRVDESSQFAPQFNSRCDLAMRKGTLVAVGNQDGQFWFRYRNGRNGDRDSKIAVVWTMSPFFIPEHLDVGRLTGSNPDLWVEVTVPAKGPPRPIRLGLMRGGTITPLHIE
jgi:hypothetical protein